MDLTARLLDEAIKVAPLSSYEQNWVAARSVTKDQLIALSSDYQARFESEGKKLVIIFRNEEIRFLAYSLEDYQKLINIVHRIDRFLNLNQDITILQLATLSTNLTLVPEHLIPSNCELRYAFNGETTARVLSRLPRKKLINFTDSFVEEFENLVTQYKMETK